MLIEQTILTSEPLESARESAIAYFKGIGYRLVDGGEPVILERGSKLGSFTGFKINQWFARAELRFAPAPGATTQIAVRIDVDTSGQLVINAERKKWAAEHDGLVQAVGGQAMIHPSSGDPLNQQIELHRRFQSGASWFYWIGGLSFLNSILIRLGTTITFVIGLNITQVVDGFAFGFSEIMPHQATIFTIAAIFLDLVISAVFVLLGVLASHKNRTAYVVGIIFYIVDGLFFLLFFDLGSFLFHLLALFGLVRGLVALNGLLKQERTNIASIHQPA